MTKLLFLAALALFSPVLAICVLAAAAVIFTLVTIADRILP